MRRAVFAMMLSLALVTPIVARSQGPAPGSGETGQPPQQQAGRGHQLAHVDTQRTRPSVAAPEPPQRDIVTSTYTDSRQNAPADDRWPERILAGALVFIAVLQWRAFVNQGRQLETQATRMAEAVNAARVAGTKAAEANTITRRTPRHRNTSKAISFLFGGSTTIRKRPVANPSSVTTPTT